MNQLTAKKNRKKQSAFQKLWKQAERQRQQNSRFQDELDALVRRIQTTIQPAEREAAKADKPLLHKLLTLGQRKSLTQWQRGELDLWIQELLHEMHSFGLVDPALLDDMARYDAFRMGITLGDEELAPPAEQLTEFLQREQAAHKAAIEEARETQTARKQAAQEEAERRVDRMLDQQLGPEPKQQSGGVEDLWQDELDQELERQRAHYQEARAALREELLDEMLKNIDLQFEAEQFASDEFEPFDFNFKVDAEGDYADDYSEQESILPDAPSITNQVFQRLFRSTATKLHPDRELDPDLRKLKQGLMSDLLKARKKGDVMTIIALYQEHVGAQEGFSTADEKQLIAALKLQVSELKEEQDQIAQQSPLHLMVYEQFYSASTKKIDKAIAEHLAQISQDKINIELMVKDIRSLKTLKPWLEDRYDERDLHSDFADLSEIFGQGMRF